jgi:hypothetical protein
MDGGPPAIPYAHKEEDRKDKDAADRHNQELLGIQAKQQQVRRSDTSPCNPDMQPRHDHDDRPSPSQPMTTRRYRRVPECWCRRSSIIVVHFNPDTGGTDAPGSETTSKTQHPSATYSSNYDSAWDIHGGTSPIVHFNRVLMVKDAQGNTQDGVPFVRTGRTDATFLPQLQELQNAGQWLPANCGGATCDYDSTTPTAAAVSVNWDGVSTDRTTTVRRVSPTTDSQQASDWAVGASSLGAP